MSTAPTDAAGTAALTVAAKLAVPPLADDMVVRPRLLRTIDAGLRAGVVVVSAPPGYGKTQLVASWARAGHRHRVAWMTLDAGDRDPDRCLRHLVATLAATPVGAPSPPLPPPGPAGGDGFAAQADTLADALAGAAGEVVLVLDDAHEIEGSGAAELLRAAARFPWAAAGLVVIARAVPPVRGERLRVAGQLTEVGAADLAFTAGEARAFLRRNDVTLTDAELGHLLAATGGWPAAIRLAASVLRDEDDVAGAIAGFAGDDGRLADYLMAEVYGRQPGDVQAFLRRTCVVERICGDLADALTGRGDGDRVLAELHRRNLFLDPVDTAPGWYRWHPAFAAALRTRLHAPGGAAQRRLHGIAAGWLHREGHHAEAARHAAAAGDVEGAARIIREHGLDLVAGGGLVPLGGLVALLDDDAECADTGLAVVRAFADLGAGDLDTADRRAACAALTAGARAKPVRIGVEAAATAVQLRAAAMTGRDRGGAALAGRRLLAQTAAPACVPTREERLRRAVVLHALGALETVTLLDTDAARHLRAARSEAARFGWRHLELCCEARLVHHDLRAGRLGRGARRARAVLDTAAVRGWVGDPDLAVALVDLAEIEMLQDEPAAALRHVDALPGAVRPADLVTRFRASFLRSLALCALGRLTDAGAERGRLAELARRWDAPAWARAMVRAAAADQLACEGRTAAALQVLGQGPQPVPEPAVSRPYAAALAGALLRAGRPGDVRAVLVRGLDPDGSTPVRVACLVLEALAADALGRRETALDAMERALGAAGDERLIRPFAAPGGQVRPLLVERLDRGTAHEVLATAVLAHMLPRQPTCGRSPYYVEPLSRRELEVLRLLQGTFTNEEIAARLFVSLNTLRSHIKSIDRKLGAANRRDAVHRARELGIV